MSHSHTFAVKVTEVTQVTPLIKHFVLKAADGAPMPAFSGGSHVIVVMKGASRVYRNPYSLLSSPNDLSTYEIAVRRADQSRGGSVFMHEHVTVGTELQIAHPVNLFQLDKLARKHVLFAGGVGITAIAAQLEDLKMGSVPYELHYSVRGPEHAAFADRLTKRHGDRVRIYYDSADQRIDIEGLVAAQPLGTHVYVCGPTPMIDRVVSSARAAGWANSHIHWEQFSAPPIGDPFEVVLKKSNVTLRVLPDQSLLEAIEDAGVDAPYLCRGGVCGECKCRVIEVDGTLVHNDNYLSAEEKASGALIMPCVSRAQGKTLVLDL
jgi:ferredoxin-NADP reductase